MFRKIVKWENNGKDWRMEYSSETAYYVLSKWLINRDSGNLKNGIVRIQDLNSGQEIKIVSEEPRFQFAPKVEPEHC